MPAMGSSARRISDSSALQSMVAMRNSLPPASDATFTVAAMDGGGRQTAEPQESASLDNAFSGFMA
jgi:hypothetical protein